MATCGLSPVTDIGPVCGGHGACIPNPTKPICSCEEGWQGESDFQVTNSLLDCQINILAIRILWGLFLAFHIAVFARYLPKVKWLWRKHQTMIQRNREIGKKYKIYHNKGLFAILPYVTVGWLCQTVYALVKIIDQNQKIGKSVLITILYIVWRITFYFACDTFQPALLASLLRSQRNLDHIIALNYKLSQLHLLVTSAVSINTIIPLVVSDVLLNPSVGMISIAVFFLVTSIAMLFFGIQGAYIGAKVKAILGHSYELNKESRTKRLMDKIAINQKQIRNTGIIQFFIYGVFGCFPYLWNKHDYMLPFAWCFVALTVRQAVNSLVHEDDDASSSARDGSITSGSGDPIASNKSPPQNRPRPPAPAESTVYGTVDTNSVVEVDEHAPALLATAEVWEQTKKNSGS